jgi:hypothetical protein
LVRILTQIKISAFDRCDAKITSSRNTLAFRTTGYATRVDRDEIMRVLRALHAARLEYVLIGAAAMVRPDATTLRY